MWRRVRQTGVWKSPWSVAEDFGVGFCWSGRRAELLGEEGVKCVRHHSFTGFVRIGRYVGETCDAKDALVKVLLYVCETALSVSLGGEESGRRRSPFDPASSSHHGRQRNLRISPFERKLKTSCTRVTKTSSREDLRFFTKKMRDWKEATEPLPPSSSAPHPRPRARDRDLPSRASWPLAKANRKYLAAVELPDAVQREDVQRFVSEGCRVRIDGLDRSWRPSAQGQRTTGGWNQYAVKGSAELIIKLAWETALAKGYEDQCPCAFSDFCSEAVQLWSGRRHLFNF